MDLGQGFPVRHNRYLILVDEILKIMDSHHQASGSPATQFLQSLWHSCSLYNLIHING